MRESKAGRRWCAAGACALLVAVSLVACGAPGGEPEAEAESTAPAIDFADLERGIDERRGLDLGDAQGFGAASGSIEPEVEDGEALPESLFAYFVCAPEEAEASLELPGHAETLTCAGPEYAQAIELEADAVGAAGSLDYEVDAEDTVSWGVKLTDF